MKPKEKAKQLTNKYLCYWQDVKHELLLNSNHVFCPHCGVKRELKVYTDLNSGRVCKNRLCKGKANSYFDYV